MGSYNIFESSQSLDSLLAWNGNDDQAGPLMNHGGDPDPPLNIYDGGSQPLSLNAILSDNDLNVNSDLLLEGLQETLQMSVSQLEGLGVDVQQLFPVNPAEVAPRQDPVVPNNHGPSNSEYLDRRVTNALLATKKELFQSVMPDQDTITLDNWEGDYKFNVQPYPTLLGVSKKCLYNAGKNKLWTSSGVVVPFKIDLDFRKVPDLQNWFLRASLVFLENDVINQPVLRCAGHKDEESKITDEDKLHRLPHVLRPQDEKDFEYVENQTSKRCYVVGNVKEPEPGVNFALRNFVFSCRNSCIPVPTLGTAPVSKELGIQFILYDTNGEMQGRRLIKLRVCSAPVRDMKKELELEAAGGVKRKRRSGGSEENAKRARLGKEEGNDVAPQARSVVTVPKHGREEEEINNSFQESVYSQTESNSKIALKTLVKDIQWCLQQKKSPRQELREYSGHVFQALRGLQGLTQCARRLDALSTIKEERSPDGGFHDEVGGQDQD